MLDEKKIRLPKWARRILVAAAIVAPIAAAVATTVKTYYEVRSAQKSAKQADQKSEVSYETLAPAVQELQLMSEEEQIWANEMSDYTDGLEMRIIRLEAYVEVLSSQRNMPRVIPPVAANTSRDPASSPPTEPKRAASWAVPQSLDKAKAYQKQRTKEKCAADDPLCGAL